MTRSPIPLPSAPDALDGLPFYRRVPAVDPRWGPRESAGGVWQILWNGEPLRGTYPTQFDAEADFRKLLVYGLHEQDLVDHARHFGPDA